MYDLFELRGEQVRVGKLAVISWRYAAKRKFAAVSMQFAGTTKLAVFRRQFAIKNNEKVTITATKSRRWQ
jgi:hypothetical protein